MKKLNLSTDYLSKKLCEGKSYSFISSPLFIFFSIFLLRYIINSFTIAFLFTFRTVNIVVFRNEFLALFIFFLHCCSISFSR